MSESKCPHCQQLLLGPFCHHCGEQEFSKKQRQVTVIIGDLLDSLYSVDNRFLKSLILFFIKPGFLAHEYCRGVRVPYIKPMSFFLIINLLYFIVSPMTDFSLPLKSQTMQPYAALVNDVVNNHMSLHDITFEQLAARYDPLSQTLAKSLVILSIPLLLPFIWLANPNKQFYLIDHTVNALYTYSFILLWPMLIILGIKILSIFDIMVSDSQSLLPLLLIPSYLYVLLSQHNQYKSTWLVSCFKAGVIFVGILISHFVYRMLQFFIVWWQITG